LIPFPGWLYEVGQPGIKRRIGEGLMLAGLLTWRCSWRYRVGSLQIKRPPGTIGRKPGGQVNVNEAHCVIGRERLA